MQPVLSGKSHVARILWMALMALVLVGSALPAQAVGKRAKQRQLTETQMLFTKAMRWGEFEQAWSVVDPKVRQERMLSALELSRYEQIEISGYSEVGSMSEPDGTVVRLIDARMVNRNTMTERTVRLRERWRWDDQDEQWWLQDGLPDLWKGR